MCRSLIQCNANFIAFLFGGGRILVWRAMPENNMAKGSPNRAWIFTVVAGVLALLSLMAVTFAIMSRTELAGDRTLTDRQVAEFAAQQGLQTVLEILPKDDPTSTTSRSPGPHRPAQ